MRRLLRLVPALALVAPAMAQAPSSPHPEAPPDAALQALVREALDANPDLARARALAEASKERIPQAGALPDPTLSLGLQNDGFSGLQVGKMPTSFYEVMVTQPLPWPGKRGARAEVEALGAEVQEATVDRTRLTLVSDLERAYLGLVLLREQAALLDQQAAYLTQAEGSVKVRYEVGQGSQSDLLRVQLERTRLAQEKVDLAAQEVSTLATLNRLRRRPSETPFATPSLLEALALPTPRGEAAWMAQGEAQSPDLVLAKRSQSQAARRLDLARLEVRPDLAVSAGYMPRGSFEPMWKVSVSIGLPIFSGRKQQKAVAEQARRAQAEGHEVASVRTLLQQRTRERLARLSAGLEAVGIYREGLLVQSEASFRAALAQFEAGKAPFLAVLEALNGWVADRSGFLVALAQVHAQDIALREFNLGPTPALAAASLGARSLDMGGGSRPMPRPAPSSATASAMSSM